MATCNSTHTPMKCDAPDDDDMLMRQYEEELEGATPEEIQAHRVRTHRCLRCGAMHRVNRYHCRQCHEETRE